MDLFPELFTDDDEEYNESAIPPAKLAAFTADLLREIEGVSVSASASASAAASISASASASASAAASVSASAAASVSASASAAAAASAAASASASAAAAAAPDESDANSREIILDLPSKKRRTSGDFLGQNFAAVTGINLTEEEKLLLSGPPEGAQASEATRNVVQEEEEEKLFLDKWAEEYLQRVIIGAIKISKQRAALEKAKHQIVTTPDIQNKIVSINQKAEEEWDRRQAEEAQELLPQGNKNKEKVNDWRTAGHVAEQAAVDGDYLVSNCQLMSEQTGQKHEGLNLDFTSQAGGSIPVNIRTDSFHMPEEHPNLDETFCVTLSDVFAAIDDVFSAMESESEMSSNLWMRRLFESRHRSSNKQ